MKTVKDRQIWRLSTLQSRRPKDIKHLGYHKSSCETYGVIKQRNFSSENAVLVKKKEEKRAGYLASATQQHSLSCRPFGGGSVSLYRGTARIHRLPIVDRTISGAKHHDVEAGAVDDYLMFLNKSFPKVLSL